jgi:hypothetical protein
MPQSVPTGVYAACLDEMWMVNMPFDQFPEEKTRRALLNSQAKRRSARDLTSTRAPSVPEDAPRSLDLASLRSLDLVHSVS